MNGQRKENHMPDDESEPGLIKGYLEGIELTQVLSQLVTESFDIMVKQSVSPIPGRIVHTLSPQLRNEYQRMSTSQIIDGGSVT